jgi:hypothetical protein
VLVGSSARAARRGDASDGKVSEEWVEVAVETYLELT